MFKEIEAFETYLTSFRSIKKPQMPNFNISAYTDNEYVCAIEEIMFGSDLLDDEYLTIRYLKGD